MKLPDDCETKSKHYFFFLCMNHMFIDRINWILKPHCIGAFWVSVVGWTVNFHLELSKTFQKFVCSNFLSISVSVLTVVLTITCCIALIFACLAVVCFSRVFIYILIHSFVHHLFDYTIRVQCFKFLSIEHGCLKR